MTATKPAQPRLAANGSAEAKASTDLAAFEGEIREFIRRDVTPARRPRNMPDTLGDPSADQVSNLVWRVSGASMEEIDRVILELQGVRDMLRNEGERVTREIAGFASLSHAAMTSMRIIADSLTQWKSGAQLRPEGHPANRP